MISHTTQAFRTAFAQLPAQVQEQAREAYKLFRQNPYHPSLRWKHVHPTKPIYSARVGRGYRAVGIRDADEVVWFWIGPHAAYDQLWLGCSRTGVPWRIRCLPLTGDHTSRLLSQWRSPRILEGCSATAVQGNEPSAV